MISESTMLRCIANCLETSEFYVGKGDRASADWWHNRANMYAARLAAYRQIDALRVAVATGSRRRIASYQVEG
jgi:hypothetical protein